MSFTDLEYEIVSRQFILQNFNLMKNIALTGANGFIGKSICRNLINSNFRLRAFVRNSKEIIKADNIEYIKIDSEFNKVNWEDFLKGCECVIHCAGSVPNFKKEN